MRINHLINVVYTAHYLSMYKGNIWCIVDFGHAKIAAVGIPRGPSCALKETLTLILANLYSFLFQFFMAKPVLVHLQFFKVGSAPIISSRFNVALVYHVEIWV